MRNSSRSLHRPSALLPPWRPPAGEKSVYFNTVGSDYISFADPPRIVDNSTDFFFEVVIRPRAAMGVYDTPVSKHTLTQGVYFSTNNPVTKVFFAIDDVDVGLTFPLASAGEARYYAVSYHSSTLYGYSAPYDGTIGGVLSTVGTAFPAAPTTTNAAVEIGGLSAQAGFGVGFQGEVLWFRWWNKGKSPSEVNYWWNRRLIPGERPPKDLAFWWDAAMPRRDLVSGLGGTFNGTVSQNPTYAYPPYFWTQRDRRRTLPLLSIEAGSTNTTVTPGAASLTLSAFAPTVTASDHKLVTPGVASLTLTGFAPAVTVNNIVTPGAASLSLTGFGPTVSVSNNQLVTPGTASLTLSAFAPTVTATANQVATPDTATLTLTGFAPTVSASGGVAVTPGAASLVLSAFAPTVTATANQLVTPAAASLTLSAFAPTVSVTSGNTVVPGPASLTLTGYAPMVLTPVAVTPGAASLTITRYAPTVLAPRLVTPGTASLTLSGLAPTVSATANVLVSPAVLALIITLYAPSVVSSSDAQVRYFLGSGRLVSRYVGTARLTATVAGKGRLEV